MDVAGIPRTGAGCPVTYGIIAVGFIPFGGDGLQDPVGGIVAVAFRCAAALGSAVAHIIQSISGAGDLCGIRSAVRQCRESACIVIAVAGSDLIGVACCGALAIQVVTKAEDSGRAG